MNPLARQGPGCYRVGAALVSLLLLAGCESDPLAPFEPEVTNAIDNFQLQATGVTDVTHTRSYTWQNTGTRATVNHSTTTSAGTTRLLIRDPSGAVVYDKGLLPSLNEASAVGVAGAWQIELILTGYSGTLNFRVQKL
jgi:hypothetical protein